MTDPTTNVETALLHAIQASRTPKTEMGEYFWASSLGFCPRKQVAERLRLPPTNPPDARSQFKMWTGTVLGNAIQAALETEGYLDPAWREKSFQYENYTGRIDGYTPTLNAIVEIKTSDDDSITRYKEMPDHYLYQGLWYCLASGIPNLLIFQIGKNQGLVRNRFFTLTDEWKDTLVKEMAGMDAWWKDYQRTGLLPEHLHTWGWEDKYCPYLEDDLSELTQQEATSPSNGTTGARRGIQTPTTQ